METTTQVVKSSVCPHCEGSGVDKRYWHIVTCSWCKGLGSLYLKVSSGEESGRGKHMSNFPRLGSAVLVQHNGRLLLCMRDKEPQKGKWVLPGGKVEPFESIAEAAKRELLEETGLVIEVGKLVGVYEIIAPPDEHRVIVYSWGSVKAGELRPSSDSTQVRFFLKEDLWNIEMTPLVGKVLKDTGWL